MAKTTRRRATVSEAGQATRGGAARAQKKKAPVPDGARPVSDRRDAEPQGERPGASRSRLDLDVALGLTLRRMREERGLSIQALARQASLSPGTIHKVENDAMVPSVTVLLKLARALDCTVGDLLAEDAVGGAREVAVFRAEKRPVLTFAEAPVRVHPIVGKLVERQLEAGVYVVEPGARSSLESLAHAGEKLYYVLDGTLRFVVDGRTYALSRGDALHLKARLPHRWENAGDTVAELLFVLTPPLGTR